MFSLSKPISQMLIPCECRMFCFSICACCEAIRKFSDRRGAVLRNGPNHFGRVFIRELFPNDILCFGGHVPGHETKRVLHLCLVFVHQFASVISSEQNVGLSVGFRIRGIGLKALYHRPFVPVRFLTKQYFTSHRLKQLCIRLPFPLPGVFTGSKSLPWGTVPSRTFSSRFKSSPDGLYLYKIITDGLGCGVKRLQLPVSQSKSHAWHFVHLLTIRSF